MSYFNVVLLQPPNYPFAMALWDIAKLLHLSFQSLGKASALRVNSLEPSAINVLLGYHLIDKPHGLDRFDCIIYQTEQLSDHEGWFNEARLDVLRRARAVWDYSPQNIEFLRGKGLERLHHLPLGFHGGMQTIARVANPDIDVLFYGTLNERRQAVLEELNRRCSVKALFGIYGGERDAYIARSKIVLNLHFYEAQIMEQARISYLLNNGCCVVSEDSASNPYEGMIAVTKYDQIVETCLRLVANPPECDRIAREGRAKFSQQPMTQILQSAIEPLQLTR